MKLSIIIVNYNTTKFLETCLASLQDVIDAKRHEVIVVDNASLKDPSLMIKKRFPFVIFIQNKENLGFAKANNIGVKQSKGEYVLFLNPDTVVPKDVLPAMLSFIETHKDAGAATCRVELPGGALDDASHRGFPTPWNAFCYFFGLSRIFPRSRIFAGYNLGWKNLSKVHEIDACAGAFMLVRREGGEQVGWWDEDYFWYGEDLDFCYILKEKGWKIFFVPTVSIFHYKGVSGGIKSISKDITTATKETKIHATKARFEAMRIFYKKYYMEKYPFFITRLIMLGIDVKQWYAIKNL